MKILLLLVSLLFSPVIFANTQWQIIPTESHLTFTATQNGAPVTGEFKSFSGNIVFNPAELKTSQVMILVDILSVTTSYKEVETTLKSADWFDGKAFPQAIFKAANFSKLDDKTYEATGTLTIRDKTVPVVLKFTLEKFTKDAAVAKGYTTIKRSDFGVGRGEWAKTDAVKDEVRVEFVVEAKV